MNNNDLDFKKFEMRSTYACVKISPYMEFKDGTKGSVLLLRYNCADSLLILINSPERADECETCNNNGFSNAEVDLFFDYQEMCKQKFDGRYCKSKERYDEFGVVVLADMYITALIADFICSNINRQNPRQNWNTTRTDNLLSKALTDCKMSEVEDELKEFQSDNCKWERGIIVETLSQFHAEEVFIKNIVLDWKRIRSKYVEWLWREDFIFKLAFAEQIRRKFIEQSECDWRRMLEVMMHNKKQVTRSFRISRYGFQEIMGLYALCKYFCIANPDKIDIRFYHVIPDERFDIFREYFDRFSDEMLAELRAEDDPLSTRPPTGGDADDRAKQRILALRGHRPHDLPEQLIDTYDKYEQAFFKSQQIDLPGETSSVSLSPALQRKRGTRASTLFIDHAYTDIQARRLLDLLTKHKLSNEEVDAARDNDINQIMVCFYRVWQQQNKLTKKAGGTALARFANECKLHVSVLEKAHANALNRMIHSSDKYPKWNGEIRELCHQ